MHSKPELREILYIFSPLLIYLLIYFAVSSLTEAVLWGIEQHSAAVTPDTGDPALYYAAGIFRRGENDKLTVQILAQRFMLGAHLALNARIRANISRLYRRKQIVAFHHSLQ